MTHQVWRCAKENLYSTRSLGGGFDKQCLLQKTLRNIFNSWDYFKSSRNSMKFPDSLGSTAKISKTFSALEELGLLQKSPVEASRSYKIHFQTLL